MRRREFITLTLLRAFCPQGFLPYCLRCMSLTADTAVQCLQRRLSMLHRESPIFSGFSILSHQSYATGCYRARIQQSTTEVRTVIKHVTKRLKRHWRRTRITWRGDSHYGRVEAMEWAENNDADYIFGLAGNAALDALMAETAVNLRFHHAMSSKAKLRTFASFMYQANSWKRPRKVVARLECSLQPIAGETDMRQEVDIRYIVTSLAGTAQHLYERISRLPIARQLDCASPD
jgi:Transposase DDE domain group 1